MNIPGEFLSADLGSADLMGIAYKYPTLFWVGLIVFVALCIVYAVYYIVKKKNASN